MTASLDPHDPRFSCALCHGAGEHGLMGPTDKSGTLNRCQTCRGTGVDPRVRAAYELGLVEGATREAST